MPYQEAQFGKILKPATRAGFKIWSGRQDAPFRRMPLKFNMLIPSADRYSPIYSRAPIDLKELMSRTMNQYPVHFVNKNTKSLSRQQKIMTPK